MNKRVLVGGPWDGQERAVFAGLKVGLGLEYGWKHACGHDSFAFGKYDFEGVWHDANRDVQLPDKCSACREVN